MSINKLNMLVFISLEICAFKSTSHDPTTANDNLENKSYFLIGLLFHLVDILIPVDARLIILGIFHLVFHSEGLSFPSNYGIPLGTLDGFLVKSTFSNFDVLRNPLETGS